MNICFIIGTLTREPEQVQGTQKTLCKMSVAVNENYTKEDGTRPVQFFNISCWGALADNCLKYLTKGSKIGVAGKMQTRSWEDNGVKKYTTEIVANEIDFIYTKKD